MNEKNERVELNTFSLSKAIYPAKFSKYYFKLLGFAFIVWHHPPCSQAGLAPTVHTLFGEMKI